MPTDISQLRSLLGRFCYYRKFLPESPKRPQLVTDLLKQYVPYCFTPEMERTIQDILHKLREPHIIIYLDWHAAVDVSRPFKRYCDAGCNGFGATLELNQPDGNSSHNVFESGNSSQRSQLDYSWARSRLVV